jgi:hypothetical protein
MEDENSCPQVINETEELVNLLLEKYISLSKQTSALTK